MKKVYFIRILILGLLFPIVEALGQDNTVSGKVVSVSGDPLIGANITQKGTTNGVTADVNGAFKLKLNEKSKVLIVSFIGFVSQEIIVDKQSDINITLLEDFQNLNEVVVVGYGTQQKVNLTGALTVISGEQLESRPIANVGEGLQGLIPNLNVTVTSGDPTRSPTFNIRGFESINGGSPLILVDGVPQDLNRINPEDIESLTVLKDGAASAIYGARAAFGVILVTTKKGKKGINVQLNTLFSWNRPIFNVDPIENGYTYVLERNKVSVRDGGTPTYNDDYVEKVKNYWADPENNPSFGVNNGAFENYGYANLAKGLMNSVSPRQKIDLAVSGATDKANYYTSFGFFNNDGFYNNPGNDNFKRYNILAKTDFKVKKWMTFSSQINANIYNSDKPSSADINTLIRIEPMRPHVIPLIPGYEEFEGKFWDHGLMIYPQLENGGRRKETSQDIWLKSGLVLTPIKNMTLNTNISYNLFNSQLENAQLPYESISFNLNQPNPVAISGNDEVSINRGFNQYYVFNAFGDYVIDKWSKHYIKVMAGFNQEWDYRTSVSGSAKTFVSPSIVDIGATTGTQIITGGKTRATLRGGFSRINYIFNEKYLFEASARYDGTSRFPNSDRFGLFPSASAGWRISKEKFMSATSSWLDNLKIRASYGSLGNQLLGNNFYPYIPSLNISSSNFVLGSGNIPFIAPPGLVSPSLTWEKVISQNLGIDATFFNNKLDMSFDVYTRATKDMLLRREYPDILGANPPQQNGADLLTKGWEYNVTYRNNTANGLGYNINFNISDWTSEITKYDNPTGALSEYYVGQKLGEIWGYETVGVIQDETQLANLPDQSRLSPGFKVGDLEFADLNGDGIISPGLNTLEDPGDRKIIGNTTPRYSFGINSGVTFKGFSVDAFFQGVGRRDYFPSNSNWTWFFPWRSYNGDKSWLTDTWTPENRDAYFPEAQISARNNVTQTRFLQNASYIRLKNLSIGYNLPSNLVDKVGLKSVRVYVASQNLWEYSKIRKPLDPEYVYDNSIDYPLLRTYSTGLTINF